MPTRSRFASLVLVLVIGLSACASQPNDQIMLMPAPDVFDQGDWDPFTDRDPIKDIPYGGVLYATDREPARKEGQYYQDERGLALEEGQLVWTLPKDYIEKLRAAWLDARSKQGQTL